MRNNIASTYESELPAHKSYLRNSIIDLYNQDTEQILSSQHLKGHIADVNVNALTKHAGLEREGDGVHYREGFNVILTQIYVNMAIRGLRDGICARSE